MHKKILNKQKELIGKEFETKSCGKCFIIDYRSHREVTVLFHEPMFAVVCRMDHLRNGLVYNPYARLTEGVGYIGVGKYSPSNDKEAYTMWQGILMRSYSERYVSKKPTYKGVTVCDEWHSFQNFAEWCYTQKYFKAEDNNGRPYHLDKDILCKGNKVYQPNSCRIVPQFINSLVVTSKGSRGDHPIGVSYREGDSKYEAYYNADKRVHLGLFKTSEEAFQAYKTAKEAYIKEVAERWKGKIDDKVYQALLEWKIEITD